MTKNKKCKCNHAAHREKLPEVRQGLTKRVEACGFVYYITVNFNKEKPLEVFVQIAKEGSSISGFVDGIVIAISIALQYGTPWEVLYDKYLNQIFEPRDDKNSSLVHSIATEINELSELWVKINEF